jgi:hypothetical protein
MIRVDRSSKARNASWSSITRMPATSLPFAIKRRAIEARTHKPAQNRATANAAMTDGRSMLARF